MYPKFGEPADNFQAIGGVARKEADGLGDDKVYLAVLAIP